MNELSTTTDLQKITTGLESFEARKAEQIALAESAKGVKVKDLNDKDGFKEVRAKRIELRKSEIPIENEAKALRDLITPISKHISAKEKELLKITEEQKARLIAEEVWYEDENAKIQALKDAAEKAKIQKRIDGLAAYGFTVDYILVLGMSDEEFEDKLNNARIVFEAEQQKIATEKAEEERLKKEELDRLKKVAEEQAQIKLEQDRIAKKQLEAQQRINEQARAIQEERDRLEADAKEKIRQAEIEAVKRQAAQDAIKQAEETRKREHQEKEEKEANAKLKAEKKAAKAPDKEKAIKLFKSLTIDYNPELTFKDSEISALAVQFMGECDLLMQNYLNKIEAL